MTSEANEPRARRPASDNAGEAGSSVVLGLLAPPQMPEEMVEQLASELPGALSERTGDRVSWEVPTIRDKRVPNVEGGGNDGTVDDVREWKREGWDLAVCMTDLPLLRADGRAVVADAFPQRDVALISLPALGLMRRRQHAREVIVRFVEEILGESPGLGRGGERRREEGWRVASGDDGHLQLVMPAGLGQLRLLAGMVRATRPFRVVLGLSYALAAALGTAAFTLLTNTIWQLSGALGTARLSVLTVVSLVTMVVYLIVVHNLWYRPAGRGDRKRALLFNATTVIALTIGALSFYAALLALTLVAAEFIIEGGVLERELGHPPGHGDYLVLAWMVSSLSTLGGTLGSGLETSDDVREAAYTYHRERHAGGGDGSD